MEVSFKKNASTPDHQTFADGDEFYWDALRSGDRKALDYIYMKYISLLQWYGVRITPNQAVVEDSIQELYIELWNKRSLLSSTTSIKFYLFKSLRRRIAKKLKKESWHQGLLSLRKSFEPEFAFSRESTIISEETDNERETYVKNIIGNLSKRQQEIIYLKFYEDLAPPQIAEVMQLTIPSVYSLLGKAFAALRKSKIR